MTENKTDLKNILKRRFSKQSLHHHVNKPLKKLNAEVAEKKPKHEFFLCASALKRLLEILPFQ
jgi:hypothetical protein